MANSQKWRNSSDYRKWRISVIRRDKVCQICGSRKSRNAHHMNHSTYFQEERFDVNNGVTVCAKCHRQFHCNFKRSFRTKCTKYDWANFVCLMEYSKEIFYQKMN